MSESERLNILWADHHSHVDEHRLLSRRLDEFEAKIKEYHRLMLGRCPFDIQGDNYKELVRRNSELEMKVLNALRATENLIKLNVDNIHQRIDEITIKPSTCGLSLMKALEYVKGGSTITRYSFNSWVSKKIDSIGGKWVLSLEDLLANDWRVVYE